MNDDDEVPDYLPYLEPGDAIKDGVWRRGFDSCVTFQPDYLYYDDSVSNWDYAVEKYPFVPGFHVVRLFDDDDDTEIVLSTHKTLAEAISICKVLLANGGVHYA